MKREGVRPYVNEDLSYITDISSHLEWHSLLIASLLWFLLLLLFMQNVWFYTTQFISVFAKA